MESNADKAAANVESVGGEVEELNAAIDRDGVEAHKDKVQVLLKRALKVVQSGACHGVYVGTLIAMASGVALLVERIRDECAWRGTILGRLTFFLNYCVAMLASVMLWVVLAKTGTWYAVAGAVDSVAVGVDYIRKRLDPEFESARGVLEVSVKFVVYACGLIVFSPFMIMGTVRYYPKFFKVLAKLVWQLRKVGSRWGNRECSEMGQAMQTQLSKAVHMM